MSSPYLVSSLPKMPSYASVLPDITSFPSSRPADVAGAKFSAKKSQQSSSLKSGVVGSPTSLDSYVHTIIIIRIIMIL